MKKVFLEIIAFVVVSSASAQHKKSWFGGEVGVGVSKFTSDDYYNASLVPKMGFDVGIKAECFILSKLSLNLSAGYQRLATATEKTPVVFNSDGTTEGTSQFGGVYQFVRVPFQISFYPTKRLAISAGLVSQFLFQQNRWYDIQSQSGNDNGRGKASLDDYKTYVLSGLITIGYDLISKESFKLNLQGFYESSDNMYK